MPNQIITLDKMKDMSIDHIIDLYRQGHILEGIQLDTNMVNLQGCHVAISADFKSAYVGDFIRLTATVDPPAPDALVTFKAQTTSSSKIINFDIGTPCDASTGTCYIDWSTPSVALIHVTAEVSGPYSCTSSPIDIKLLPPPKTLEDVFFIAIVAIPASLFAAYLLYSKYKKNKEI